MIRSKFTPAQFTPVTRTASPQYDQALAGFGQYRGTMQGLSTPFYPMAYGLLSQYFPQVGLDPFGDSVRRASQEPQLSQVEQMRKQWEEKKAIDAEGERQRAEWRNDHAAKMNAWSASGGKAAHMAGMSPANRQIYSLMYGMY